MQKVCVIGLGLIGGSLALCFKRSPGIVVSGYDLNSKTLSLARQLGVVDEIHQDLAEAVQGADAVFIATPVQQVLGVMRELAALPLKVGCIISDTGSTKSEIAKHGEKWFRKDVVFIGGHPMAGSHHSGVEAASDRLFENAYYVLTPAPDTPNVHVERIAHVLSFTHATVIRLSAQEHDQIVGAISHLPHIVAAILSQQIADYSRESAWYEQLAAGGFRDVTRIASSNPIMWRDILLHNRDVLLDLLSDWEKRAALWKSALKESDAVEIERFFREARNFRERIPEKSKGLLPQSYECYVDVPDHPGVIGHVASLLGQNHINLTNIRILQNREEVPGVLLLSFKESDEREKAMILLGSEGFKVY